VFEKQAGTGGFRSGYQKDSHITGDHKHILCLVPYVVFWLLYILIRVLRPIELLVIQDIYISADKQQQTFDAYSQQIFASMGRGWDDNMMRKALEKFFEKGLGVQMGVRVFRHFAVAVQRDFPQTNYGIYKTR
jgi:hypothetical protein